MVPESCGEDVCVAMTSTSAMLRFVKYTYYPPSFGFFLLRVKSDGKKHIE